MVVTNSTQDAPRCPFKPVILENVTDKTKMVDTLHKEAFKTWCTPERCTGSIMYPTGGESYPTPKTNPGKLRSKEDTRKQAIDFLKEYYASIGSENTDEHKNRVEHVVGEIEKTGTYDITSEELNFGGRMAWRNAPRCIGRIQWKKLQLFDCRHVKTPKEMFDCILRQMKYATNDGNIRSSISVFPHRSADMKDFRLWNAQLVKYAGYKQPDGSIIGDSASVEITEIAQQLGWVGEGTPFDVLPLILQANGEKPEIFDIPKEYVMEVNITHPKYTGIDDLNLKWYVLPAVANMSLDCGGLEFTAAPFNGWYMATEIGARNLADRERYNMLQPVAECMGLDTTNNMTLWKDTAMLELTKAVLHSFNAQTVTIADHHASSESFMKHLKDEQALRGGCPSDWVWIVPPMSGAATRVFHQEMLNYKLKPSYEYQTDAWRYFPLQGGEGRKKKTFKQVAEGILFSSRLFGKTMARRHKVTILYATETGKSEEYSKMLNELFLHAFDSKVVCMSDYQISSIHNEECVLVVASTFGNGEAPDNGESFERKLRKMVYPDDSTGQRRRSRAASTTSLKSERQTLPNLRYSVFALGSRAYPQFCAFGREISKYFKKLEGEEIHVLGEGDELNGQEESFKVWARNCFKAACDTFAITEVKISGSSLDIWKSVTDWEEGMFQIVPAENNKKSVDLCRGLSKVHRKNVTMAKVMSVENLQAPESGRVTDLVKLDAKESDDIIYQPGDHLCVYPANDSYMVEELLELFPVDVDLDKPIYVQKKEEDGNFETVKNLPMPVTIRQLFTRYLDITTPPSSKFLSILAEKCDIEEDKYKLGQLSKNTDVYEDWKFKKYPTILEVIKRFSSIDVDLTMLINQLPLLKPRYYSISSSPNFHPNEVHLTVAVVNYLIDDIIQHNGVCSTWLHTLKSGDLVPCNIRSAPKFHLPKNPSIPVIMVGPGTGIAPFRSFWEERENDMNLNPSVKPNMHLYFGCRNSKADNIYAQEREQGLKKGIFKKSLTAFSREENEKKTYVQHLIDKNGDEILNMLSQYGAHIYVCGDVTMASSVNKCLIELVAEFGAFGIDEATGLVNKIKTEGRYHEDIFGVTLKIEEVTNKIRDAVKRTRRASLTAGISFK